MATKILAAVLTLCVFATHGAVIREEDGDLFLTAMHTLLTEPEMLIDSFGLTRDKRHAQGPWDFDRSFGGVTLQIKYKDPAHRWKGGHAHFEVLDLKKIIPVARSKHVTFDVTFDGGAAKMDGIFNLKIEYSLEHAFMEKGIFEFDRKHVGNHWISAISNKKNGGGNGQRIFPEMEFHGKTDRSTMSTATYNSARFNSVKLDIKRDPGKQLDGTLEGTFLGKHVKITLHGTRNSATHKIDGTLTVEIGRKKYDFKITGSRKIGAERELNIKLTGNVEGQTMEIEFAGKRTEWIKFAGNLKFTYGPKVYQFSWTVDRTNGVKVHMKANIGQGDNVIKYQRNAAWKLVKFSVNVMGSEMLAIQIKRDITSTWNRKTTIVYKGTLFAKQGGQGKITLQVQEVDAHTHRFSVIADTKNEKEVLKYVNTISHNKQAHGGHQEFHGTMKANLDLKDSSQIHKFLCRDPNSIHCFHHREADISLTVQLDEPWHMLFLAKLNKDGANVVDAKIDTKSHDLQAPHVFHLMAPRLLPATFDAEVKKVGNNVVGTIKMDNTQVFQVTLNSPDGKSPYEVEFNVANINYKVSVVHEDKNGDGEEDYLDVKVFKNGPKVFDFEVDRSSWPRTFKVEYPASIAFLTHTAGKIDGTRDRGKLHVHFHPGKGKDIEIDLERTHKDGAGKHERHFMGKVQRDKQVYYEYDSTVSFGGNPSQFELDANSKMTVHSSSLLHQLACNPVMSGLNFLCFNNRIMEAKFRADKTKPYKMNVHTKVDKEGAEVFRIDMQTQTSPYKLTFNWPRMRAIVAPYRNGPLEITADHNPGNSLAITSNIQGFSQFSVVKMPNGQRKVTLNNKEVVTADFQKSGRTITQSTTLPDGRALTTTFKWGNDNNWLNNHIELDLDGTERKLDSKFEWNFGAAAGTWKLDAVGHNNRWGDYNIHRTGKYANNGGVWTFDVDGTALWKGNNVKTDVFIKLDTSKIGNGKLDAITAKLIKVVDGKKYEVNVTDGKMGPGDFVKVGAFIRDMSH
jgi:hypothetical protein